MVLKSICQHRYSPSLWVISLMPGLMHWLVNLCSVAAATLRINEAFKDENFAADSLLKVAPTQDERLN